MDRRTFIRSSAVLVASVAGGGLLAACNRGGSGIPSGQPTLAAQLGTFEVLTGGPRKVPFGLRTIANAPVTDADVAVFLRNLDGSDIRGPFATTYTEAAGPGLGLYVAELEFPEPGHIQVVAVAGDDYGEQAINVVSPAQAKAPIPGQDAISVATPTVVDDRGMQRLCTQEPPCGMHEVSLDRALDRGRPVMLLFATPAYCQTAVCGPAVGTVDGVRQEVAGQAAWIHVEIYSDAGQTLADPVQAWELPTEPWLFSIDADGVIRDRLDGPMLPDMVAEMARDLTA